MVAVVFVEIGVPCPQRLAWLQLLFLLSPRRRAGLTSSPGAVESVRPPTGGDRYTKTGMYPYAASSGGSAPNAMSTATTVGVPNPPRAPLGRGRSGVVFDAVDPHGHRLACKVFDSSGATKAVQLLFLGAPNPYLWSEDAIECAYLRRRIVAKLVRFWFGSRVRVADAVRFLWNAEHHAYELQCEFSPGRAALLANPLRTEGGDEAGEVVREILRPLQKRLVEAGLTGLVWQAGGGNPVALNNFLREPDGGWAWIDLESGVPAVIPIDPRAFFGFYLPQAIVRRRALFDDVDVPRLSGYLRSHESALLECLGETSFAQLVDDAASLESAEARWRGLGRREQRIQYRHSQGQITADRAEHYRRHPWSWYRYEAGRAVRSGLRCVRRGAAAVARRLTSGKLWRFFPQLGRFLYSQRYREVLALRYVRTRVQAWRTRGQLSGTESSQLRGRLDGQQSNVYLTDFGVHVAMKPLVKATEYWLAPALFAVGVIDAWTLALVMVTGGIIARTAYTSGRLVHSFLRGREKPWIALAVGALPVVGNFAFPVQILFSATERRDDLARFLIVDAATRVGRHVPIWGGADTRTEHFFNGSADRVTRWLSRGK